MSHAFTSALALRELYRSGEASPVEVTDELLDRIERLNPVLHCYLTVTADLPRQAARTAEGREQEARRAGAPARALPCPNGGHRRTHGAT